MAISAAFSSTTAARPRLPRLGTLDNIQGAIKANSTQTDIYNWWQLDSLGTADPRCNAESLAEKDRKQ